MLDLEAVRKALGTTEPLRMIEVTVAGVAERFSGGEPLTYAPRTVAATTHVGMFPEFVWPWAVPSVELCFADREAQNPGRNPVEPVYEQGTLGRSRILNLVSQGFAEHPEEDDYLPYPGGARFDEATYDRIIGGSPL